MNLDRRDRRIQRRLTRLPLGARNDFLRVLASPPEVRVDRIRQLYAQPDTRELAEMLMDLEAEPPLRLEVMEALKESVRQPGAS